MKISSKFTIAVHTLLLIHYFNKKHKITSNFIASSVNVNPVIIRNILLKLKNAHIVDIKAGSGGATLIKKLDERKVFVGMSVYGFLSSLLAFFVGTATNFHLGALIPTLFLMGLQFGAVNIMPMVMVADSVDYYEYKTGKRTEGVAYAVLSFSVKVTLALGSAVCLAVVFSDAVGYAATTEEFTFETSRGVYFAYTVIPGITSLLAAVPILFYDLTGKKKADIAEALRVRRAAAALPDIGNDAAASGADVKEISDSGAQGSAPADAAESVPSDEDTK